VHGDSLGSPSVSILTHSTVGWDGMDIVGIPPEYFSHGGTVGWDGHLSDSTVENVPRKDNLGFPLYHWTLVGNAGHDWTDLYSVQGQNPLIVVSTVFTRDTSTGILCAWKLLSVQLCT